ncbi:MAG: O-antigen ligase family protein [Sulfuricurvum sp.]|uniref:O-antigen ligase family protein n=1 Tax=Sulfuricurvum sp. TaxID=2025608 RepID=UPI00356432BC
MFTLLNLIAFFALTWYAVYLLYSKPSYVALSKTQKVLLTGREKFLLLTIVTGMLRFADFSATRLMVWSILVLSAFLLYRRPPKITPIMAFYIAFILWLGISFFWSADTGYAFRTYIKYVYALLIMLFAATFVRSKDLIFIAMRWLIITAFIYSVFLGGLMTHILGIWHFYLQGLFWPMSTLNDYLAMMSGLSFLLWWRTREKKYLLLVGWFFLSAVFQSVRTGLLGIFMVMAIASYVRFRALALPYIGAIALTAILSVLFIPQVREKMFYDPSAVQSVGDLEKVDTTQIDSNGRFAMWDWTLRHLYDPHPLTGSGLGTTQYVYYETAHPFYPIRVIHNDYVQMLADNGQVGLILYALFVIIASLSAYREVHSRKPDYLRNTAFLVITSFTAMSVTMMTDNVVLYVLATFSYPFIFVGLLIAYRRVYASDLRQSLQKSPDEP